MNYYPLFITHPRDLYDNYTRVYLWILALRKKEDICELGGIKQTSNDVNEARKICSLAKEQDLKWFPVNKCRDFILFDDESERRLINIMKENGITKVDLLKMELSDLHHKNVEKLKDF